MMWLFWNTKTTLIYFENKIKVILYGNYILNPEKLFHFQAWEKLLQVSLFTLGIILQLKSCHHLTSQNSILVFVYILYHDSIFSSKPLILIFFSFEAFCTAWDFKFWDCTNPIFEVKCHLQYTLTWMKSYKQVGPTERR